MLVRGTRQVTKNQIIYISNLSYEFNQTKKKKWRGS